EDECWTNTHNCSSNSQCENVPGSFRCKCKYGYGYRQKDNFTCLRIEDCKHCGANTNCIQQKGISGCFCKDADHAKCYDRKNCSLTDPAHKKCKFECDFWICQCETDYAHDSEITSAYICKDINQCTIQVGPHANNCGKNTECVNYDGSFYCLCSTGYELDYKSNHIIHCTDIDECLYKERSHAHKCGANTRCLNTVGGYKCPCLSSGFYRVDDFSCADKDECWEKTHNCSFNSQCKNVPGSFGCKCKHGYRQKDNFTCLSRSPGRTAPTPRRPRGSAEAGCIAHNHRPFKCKHMLEYS
ncbi:hypothetical protein RRG08_057959, partial [Elysia crispata]